MENPDDGKLITVDPKWTKDLREYTPAKKERKKAQKTKTKKAKRTKEIEWLQTEFRKVKLQSSTLGRTKPDYIPITKFDENDANGVTKCVVYYIKYMIPNATAWRVNNVGVFDEKSGKRRSGGGRNGQADVSASVNGMAYQIEIKFGSDRQSKAQKTFQDEFEQSGGIYIIAKTFTDFKPVFDAIIEGREPPTKAVQLNLFEL